MWSSPFVMALVSSIRLSSASELCQRFSGADRSQLPQTVCLDSAFIKTDWEAGKLRCDQVSGHIECVPAYVAAPIFDDKLRADAGLPDEVQAWAVSSGQHVNSHYRASGQLCGYLTGRSEFDFHIGDFRLAVNRVMDKQGLRLGEYAKASQGADGTANSISDLPDQGTPDVPPLEARPLLLTLDPLEGTHLEQNWLVAAVILLCFCPCAGPLPLALLLMYLCWARGGRYTGRHVVPSDDRYDAECARPRFA
jgi:hypothetical protein